MNEQSADIPTAVGELSNPTDVGKSLLTKMGWMAGKGLGADGQGQFMLACSPCIENLYQALLSLFFRATKALMTAQA